MADFTAKPNIKCTRCGRNKPYNNFIKDGLKKTLPRSC